MNVSRTRNESKTKGKGSWWLDRSVPTNWRDTPSAYEKQNARTAFCHCRCRWEQSMDSSCNFRLEAVVGVGAGEGNCACGDSWSLEGEGDDVGLCGWGDSMLILEVAVCGSVGACSGSDLGWSNSGRIRITDATIEARNVWSFCSKSILNCFCWKKRPTTLIYSGAGVREKSEKRIKNKGKALLLATSRPWQLKSKTVQAFAHRISGFDYPWFGKQQPQKHNGKLVGIWSDKSLSNGSFKQKAT